jgi:hypothetical protein
MRLQLPPYGNDSEGKPLQNSKEDEGMIIDALFRLVHKYMRQPCRMKLNRTNMDGNYLSLGVVSIALPELAS